jgi:hypothetical protein
MFGFALDVLDLEGRVEGPEGTVLIQGGKDMIFMILQNLGVEIRGLRSRLA